MTDYLQEAKENFKDAKEHVREQHARILEDFEFSNPSDPKQWDEAATTARKGRPTHTLDRTNQYVQHVVNKQREAKTSAEILPADSNADPETAKKLQGIIRHIEYTSKADIAWDTAADHQARGGLGWVRVIPKVVDPQTNQQEIIISRVHDPLSIMLDPNSTEPDGSDAMWGFVETLLTKKAFKRMYSKAKEQDFDTEGWCDEDNIRIVEYLRVKEEEETRVTISAPEGSYTISEEEYKTLVEQIGSEPPISKRFTAKTREVVWCKLSGVEILEETEYPSQWIGLVPMLGHEIWIKGKRYLCGLVRRLMDGQRLHNYEMSALTESLMIQPKAPFLIPGRAIEGYEQDWANLNQGNPAYLPYNDLDTDSQQPIAPPSRLAPPNFPIAYANTSNLAVQEMENSVGMPKASLGLPSNAVSGRAKLADQTQGETATYHFSDNRRVCQEQVYRIIVDMIPKIYDSQRIARILGEDGQQSSVVINPDQVQSFMNEGGQVSINPGVGRYDVRVKVGPSYTTIREEMGVKLQELGKGNPVLAAALTPILMKLSDMPEADKVARIAMAMLPPEVQKAYHEEDSQGIPPAAKAQLDAQGQQIQQMAQAMDQAGKVIQDLQQQVNDKNTKVQDEAKAAIAQIQLAQEQLKNQADAIAADSAQLAKDSVIAKQQLDIEKLQLELFVATQGQKMAEDSVSQVGESVNTALQQSTDTLYKSIEDGMMVLAEASKKNAEAITKLQGLVTEDDPEVMALKETQDKTLESLAELAKLVSADRERIPIKDESGSITKVIDRLIKEKHD